MKTLKLMILSFLIIYGAHHLLYDSSGNRWKILYSIDDEYNNVLENDTLRMFFRKTNIAFYLADGTSYYDEFLKRIAVKQN